MIGLLNKIILAAFGFGILSPLFAAPPYRSSHDRRINRLEQKLGRTYTRVPASSQQSSETITTRVYSNGYSSESYSTSRSGGSYYESSNRSYYEPRPRNPDLYERAERPYYDDREDLETENSAQLRGIRMDLEATRNEIIRRRDAGEGVFGRSQTPESQYEAIPPRPTTTTRAPAPIPRVPAAEESQKLPPLPLPPLDLP